MSKTDREREFESMAEDAGLLAEFWEFLCENRKFWLIPILLVLLLLGLLLIFGGSSAAPFIYTLF